MQLKPEADSRLEHPVAAAMAGAIRAVTYVKAAERDVVSVAIKRQHLSAGEGSISRRRTMKGALIFTIAASLGAGMAYSQPGDMAGDAQRGHAFAVEECSQCHRVARAAPPTGFANIGPDFAAIADSASITPTSLFVFLHSSHPPMPNIILSRQESADVIAYIISLRRPRL